MGDLSPHPAAPHLASICPVDIDARCTISRWWYYWVRGRGCLALLRVEIAAFHLSPHLPPGPPKGGPANSIFPPASPFGEAGRWGDTRLCGSSHPSQEEQARARRVSSPHPTKQQSLYRQPTALCDR